MSELAKHKPWRRRLLHVAVISFAVLLIGVAVYGEFGAGKWVAVDQPLRFLRISAESGSWHVAYVSVPEDLPLPFPNETTSATRTFVQNEIDKAEPMWQFYRASARERYRLECDWAQSVKQRAGNGVYFQKLSGDSAVVQVGEGQWTMPIAGIFAFPAWTSLIPALLLLLFPAIAAWKHRQRLRWLRYCRQCSYDLTGNQSGICPECGRALEVDMSPPQA